MGVDSKKLKQVSGCFEWRVKCGLCSRPLGEVNLYGKDWAWKARQGVTIERVNGSFGNAVVPRWTQLSRTEDGQLRVNCAGYAEDFERVVEILKLLTPEEFAKLPIDDGRVYDKAGVPMGRSHYGHLRVRCNPRHCRGDFRFDPVRKLLMTTDREVTLR